MSQGLVRWCPQGFFRENWVMYNAHVAQVCVACRPGITTPGPGAGLAADCSRVLLGHGLAPVPLGAAGQAVIPATPQADAQGLPAASLCALGFYSTSNYCAQCPAAAATRSLGAQSVEACSECLRACVLRVACGH
jgi:hypothetical protein